jgi:serine/threonine protein kinase
MEEAICSECGETLPTGATSCPFDGTPISRLEDEDDKVVGSSIGEYRIDAIIGSGGMGVVYRGVHPEIDKTVAIKVIRRHLAGDPEYVRRLKSEARAVNAVKHRAIVDIFSIGALADGRHYLIMELLEGESLSALLKRQGPLPFPAVTEILIDVCDGLSAVHEAGVIHRDLKSSNIFVITPPSGGRYVKLLDFGLAKRARLPNASVAQTSMSLVMGTPGFMAPEQARGAEVGPRTDLYALGAVAFEMITGRKAFNAPTAIDVINLQLNAPAPLPSALRQGVPPILDALVAHLLEREPADRPQSARAVSNELKRLQSDPNADPTRKVRRGLEPVTQATVPNQQTTQTTLNWRSLAVGGAVAIIAGGAGLWVRSRFFVEPPPQLPTSIAMNTSAGVPPLPDQLPPALTHPEVPHTAIAGEPNPPPSDPDSVTQEELLTRVSHLQQRLKSTTAPAGPTLNVARMLLDKAHQDAIAADTQRGRRQVAEFLDKWERQFKELH